MLYHSVHNILLRAPVPYALCLEPTQRCNCRCPFCYHPAEKGLGDMTAQQAIRAMDEARRAGCRLLHISGGEPFLYPHLQLLVLNARKSGYTVSVATNGSFTEEVFKRTYMYMDRLTVSLDFPDKRHDQWRGFNGLYDRCVASVRRAIEAGLDVRIACTLWRDNAGCIEDMAVIAKTLGCGIHFRLMTREHPDVPVALLEDAAERAATVDAIIALKKKYPGVIQNPAASLKAIKSQKPFNCRLCTAIMHVDALGRVYLPCPQHESQKDLILGNILRQPVEEIWFSRAAHAYRKQIRACKPAFDCYNTKILDPALFLKPSAAYHLEQARSKKSLAAFFKERSYKE